MALRALAVVGAGRGGRWPWLCVLAVALPVAQNATDLSHSPSRVGMQLEWGQCLFPCKCAPQSLSRFLSCASAVDTSPFLAMSRSTRSRSFNEELVSGTY